MRRRSWCVETKEGREKEVILQAERAPPVSLRLPQTPRQPQSHQQGCDGVLARLLHALLQLGEHLAGSLCGLVGCLDLKNTGEGA